MQSTTNGDNEELAVAQSSPNQLQQQQLTNSVSSSKLQNHQRQQSSEHNSGEVPKRKRSTCGLDQDYRAARVKDNENDLDADQSDDSHQADKHHIEVNILNLVDDDHSQAESSNIISSHVDREIHSGDENNGQNKSTQSFQKHSNNDKPYECLSQCEQLTSHNTPFAEHASNQRRVSEHGAALTHSQNSPWQFNLNAQSHNSANLYGWSNTSEDNSELALKNAGAQNLSDGALSHSQKRAMVQGRDARDDTLKAHEEANQTSPDSSNIDSTNLPIFSETVMSSAQNKGNLTPYHMNRMQPMSNSSQFDQQAQIAQLAQKHDNIMQQRQLHPDHTSLLYRQYDQMGADPQMFNQSSLFYNQSAAVINDFNIQAAAASGNPDSQQQHLLNQQQLWQYQNHPQMQQHHEAMQQKRSQQLIMGQQEASQFYQRMQHNEIQQAGYPMTSQKQQSMQPQHQAPDLMNVTAHTSIFSANQDYSNNKSLSQHVFETPSTQRQTQNQIYDSNMHSMSLYEQSALSTPQKNIMSSQMSQKTPTQANMMNTPDLVNLKRATQKMSTAKTEQNISPIEFLQHGEQTESPYRMTDSSQIHSGSLILQTISSPSPAKTTHHNQDQLAAASMHRGQLGQRSQQQLFMNQIPLSQFEQQYIHSAQVQQHPYNQMHQQALFLQHDSQVPQFVHSFDGQQPSNGSVLQQMPQSHHQSQQQFPSAFQLSEHTSSTTSLQLVQPMLADLQITSHNFKGNGRNINDAKSHIYQRDSRLQKDIIQGQEMMGPQKSRGMDSHRSGRDHHTGQIAKGDNSGQVRNNKNSGSGSKAQQQQLQQQSQQFAHSDLAENANDDQIANLLISKLQKLPPVTPWKDKQELLSGNVTRLATTQSGSRYLQNQLLARSNPTLIEFLLQEVGHKLSTIMVNQYGNYFFQKLLSNCSVSQRLRILHLIEGDFIKICCHKQGTHTIQTIFDNVTIDQEENFIKNALQGHVCTLSIDQQGTHVIRKVLQCRSFDQEKQAFIFDEIYANLNHLCLNKNGLCVIKIIISLTKLTRQKQRVIDQISHDLITLVSDPYGNYAVSQIIEKWENAICKPIFEKLATKIFELSNQKYSSCVIEKCLKFGDAYTRSIFIREISLSDRLGALVSHSYGNFVIQKALKVAVGHEKDDLILAIEGSFPQIPDKKIRDKWQQIIKASTEDRFNVEERDQFYDQDDYQHSPESAANPDHPSYYEDYHHDHQSNYPQQQHQSTTNSPPDTRFHQPSQFEYRQKQQSRGAATTSQSHPQHNFGHIQNNCGQKKRQNNNRRGGGKAQQQQKQQTMGQASEYQGDHALYMPAQYATGAGCAQGSAQGTSYHTTSRHQQINNHHANSRPNHANGGQGPHISQASHINGSYTNGSHTDGRGGAKRQNNQGRGGHNSNGIYQPVPSGGASKKQQPTSQLMQQQSYEAKDRF